MHQLKHFIKHFFTATRKGHNVHSPFAYQLCEEVFYNKASFYDFEKLNYLRKKLLSDNTILKVEDYGAGSRKFKSDERRVADIAGSGISSKRQSELFYKLVNFLRPGIIVELGTSLGLNTLYLSRANKNGKVYSVEGSESLVDLASNLIQQAELKNTELIQGKFDDIFPVLTEKITTIDLLYIDGNHSYEATLRYFRMALSKKNDNSVFIFDDIYWSEGMTRAWEEIKSHKAVTLTIDAFYFGMIFFRPEVKEKIDLRIWI